MGINGFHLLERSDVMSGLYFFTFGIGQNMKKLFPFLLIGGAAAYFLTQFRQFQQGLTVRLGTIKFNLQETQRAGFLRLIVDVSLILKNSSRLQGKVTGGRLDVLVGDRVVGTVSDIGSMLIQAAADTTVPVRVALNTLAIVPTINDLIVLVGSGGSQTVTIKGSVFTSFGELVVNEKMSFKI